MGTNKYENPTVFHFYDGTVESFIQYYELLSKSKKDELDDSIVFIHESNGNKSEDNPSRKWGTMYAHGKFYNMGVRPVDVNAVLNHSSTTDVSAFITNTGVDNSPQLVLNVPKLHWVDETDDDFIQI